MKTEIKENFFKVFPYRLVIEALEKELKRKLQKYKKIKRTLEEKYKLPFEEFEKSKLLEKHNYSWEVENDYIEWEHAIEGIHYCEKKLKELQKWKVSHQLKR